jgi:hypothetical protein
MVMLDFSRVQTTMEELNKWADEVNKKARKALMPDVEEGG